MYSKEVNKRLHTDLILIIDTRLTLETPEGTDLPLYPAGFWVRSLAYSLDFGIRTVISIVIAIVFRGSGIGQAIGLVCYFLLEWFYPVYFEVWRDGQTIGKKRLHLKVIHDDGTPITFSSSLIRNLLRFVDFLPLFYVTGIISSLLNRQFQRLGDLAAGTVVVYNNPRKAAPALADVGSCPVPADFTTDEQRELLAFAQRGQTMTAARQAELAQILTPLLPTSSQPVKTIQQMANYIVGRR